MARHIQTLTVAILLAGMAAMDPHASLAAELPAERVSISDLDLSTPHGQQRLERRISAAINHVCPAPTLLTRRSRSGLRDLETCRAAAAGSVQQQLAQLGLRQAPRQARQY